MFHSITISPTLDIYYFRKIIFYKVVFHYFSFFLRDFKEIEECTKFHKNNMVSAMYIIFGYNIHITSICNILFALK